MAQFLVVFLRCVPALLLFSLLAGATFAAEDRVMYLSGTGLGSTKAWEFKCSSGRECGRWTTIAVPSHWEQEGFGLYNYGHDSRPSDEVGWYRTEFTVPADWRDLHVELVFEGVMTDATARVNGSALGPTHQGGFTRFSYSVDDVLQFGEHNTLEVEVAKRSSNRSVNKAERDADYWIFGGIYRPVYLRARPRGGVQHIAIAADHDGRVEVRLELGEWREPATADRRQLRFWIEDAAGAEVSPPEEIEVSGQSTVDFQTSVSGVSPWSAEDPQLYRLLLEVSSAGREIHRTSLRFGFRTIELRPGMGLFVNGRRTLLKGVNRHAFWPPSGRTLNADLDRADVRLIKSMHFNAVRSSHYPPDVSFLEACDELGLYVIDELPGWHDAYDTEVGTRLVEEMVRRDAHHPSIVFWANGNEGGWNRRLDAEFARHDLSVRQVLHPHELFEGIDTEHYPTLVELRERLVGTSGDLPLVLPTEMLHGLYDGGSGAGLVEFWQLLAHSPRSLGGFLWSFSDESVLRSDWRGRLDSDGNHAPDGVVGPYRESSPSTDTLRKVFAPIAVTRWTEKSVEVENRWFHRNLENVRFEWEIRSFPAPGWPAAPPERMLAADSLDIEPDGRGEISIPPAFGASASTRWLTLTATEADGTEIARWSRPADRRALEAQWIQRDSGVVAIERSGSVISLRAAASELAIDLESGEVVLFRGQHGSFPLRSPSNVDGSDHVAVASKAFETDRSAGVVVMYEGGLRRVRWELFTSGWLHLSYLHQRAGEPYSGVSLSAADLSIETFEWLGAGPHRVWANRLAGPELGVWNREVSSRSKGFYRDVHWARLTHQDGDLMLFFDDPRLFLSVFTPTFPDDAEHARADVPTTGIGLFDVIPPIGSKFHPGEELSLSSPNELGDSGRGSVWILP